MGCQLAIALITNLGLSCFQKNNFLYQIKNDLVITRFGVLFTGIVVLNNLGTRTG
jgi:hypothetical protein